MMHAKKYHSTHMRPYFQCSVPRAPTQAKMATSAVTAMMKVPTPIPIIRSLDDKETEAAETTASSGNSRAQDRIVLNAKEAFGGFFLTHVSWLCFAATAAACVMG